MDIFNNLEENLNDKLQKSNLKNNYKSNCIYNDFSKNQYYFENITIKQNLNDLKQNNYFISFYKKIIKSGVGILIFGVNLDEIIKNNKNFNSYKTIIENLKIITEFAHSFGCKILFKISSNYGRFNNTNNFNFGSNFCLNPTNNEHLIIRISDGKLKQIIDNFWNYMMFSKICNFDGIMIDATFSNIIGEISSFEFNKRIFGYYSETTEFLNKTLHKIKKDTFIILKISILTFFDNEKYKVNFCNNSFLNKNQIIENLTTYIKNGVDGIEFEFGIKDNQFLHNFNAFEDELLFKEFVTNFRNYLKEIGLKNKFNEDVFIFYHDNFIDFNRANELVKNGIVDFLDITKNIMANNDFLKDNHKANCIKCSYCDELAENKNEIGCTINPKLCDNDTQFFDKQNNNICIIGAGIAGLTCAKTLIERGYKVNIIEKNTKLNHFGKLCTIFGFDTYLNDYFQSLDYEIDRLVKNNKINLNLNTNFYDKIDELKKYSSIIVATGFKTKPLKINGAILPHVYGIYDILEDKNILENKNNIIVYAKTELALKLSLYLLNNNKKIIIIINKNKFDNFSKNANFTYYLQNYIKFNANCLVFNKIIKINEDNIDIELCQNDCNNFKLIHNMMINKNQKIIYKRSNLDCDLFIFEPELIPNNSIYIDLVKNKYKGELFLIGDALKIDDLPEIIKTSYFIGKNI